VRIIYSLLFLLLCELLFIFPGGIVEIVLESTFNPLNENLISLISFLFSGFVFVLCLKLFFPHIFLRVRNLLEVNVHKITLLSAIFFSIGLLYSLIVLLGLKLNLIIEKDSLTDGTSFSSVLFLFLIAIVVATVEEIVFRGAALSYLLIRFKPLVSILLISMVFSLGHVQYSGLLPYITAFIFGIVTSILVIKTNTLYYAIGLHCGWNFFFGVHSLYFDLNSKTLQYWGSIFEFMEIGILILILFSFWIYSRNHNLSQTTDNIASGRNA